MLNGLIIVIFIILYFAFRFLKVKDSKDNYKGYSKQPYNPVYPRSRVVPPKEELSGRFEDEEDSLGDMPYEDKSYEDIPYEDKDEKVSYEAETYFAETKPFDITADYKMPEVPAPEAVGLTMPEPMSMPTAEIVIDSDVHVDVTLPLDKHKA